MAVVEVSIVPIGTGNPSVSKYVAKVLKVLHQEPELNHESTAMGTIIEGDLDKVLAVIRKMHESVFDSDVLRVVTTIKIDDRRDKDISIEGKLNSLKRELGYYAGQNGDDRKED